ncbi:MAG TPA: hypothetical protein VGF91_02855 [Solirubrobacteraceae bacterium]|jgi:hypothetical protein
MRRVALVLALALAAPSVAQASVQKIAPPGNSGVNQYLETVPTADGGQPTSTVHPVGAGVRGPGGPGGTAGHSGSAGGGAIASSTQRALASQGPAGVAAAAVADATAPRSPRLAAHSRNAGANSSVSAPAGNEGSSAQTSVLKTLTGATSGGGLGPLLPVALIGSVLAAAVLTLVRRRGTG